MSFVAIYKQIIFPPVLIWLGLNFLLFSIVLWVKKSDRIVRKKNFFLMIIFIMFIYNSFWIELTGYSNESFEPLALISTIPTFCISWMILFICPGKMKMDLLVLSFFCIIASWSARKNIIDVLWIGRNPFF